MDAHVDTNHLFYVKSQNADMSRRHCKGTVNGSRLYDSIRSIVKRSISPSGPAIDGLCDC